MVNGLEHCGRLYRIKPPHFSLRRTATMTSYRKIVVRFLFLTLCLAILVGCAPGSPYPTPEAADNAGSASDIAEGDDGTPSGRSVKTTADDEVSLGEDEDFSTTYDSPIVDSGFDPLIHGFSFANYTNRDGIENLTAEDMHRLFGDPVCARIDEDGCTLTSTARQWMEKVNRAMNGGHCEGMAVLSKLMFYDMIDPGMFGGEAAYDLTLENNPTLQREIALWWLTQITDPGSSIKVNDAPSEVVKTLQEAFAQGANVEEAWALGIYQPDMSAGHSITPAAVVNRGDGVFHVMVYDNNFPGELRPLIVDTNLETWQYQSEARFTGGSDSLYQGDADMKTLEAVAISPRLKEQDCFFCRDSDPGDDVSVEAQGGFFTIWLEGDADLLITDEEGRRLGFADGEFVDEIPGATIKWIRTVQQTESNDLEPLYLVPVKTSLNFLVDGSRLDAPGYSDFSMVGPGGFIAIDDIWVKPGETQEVSVWADSRSRYQIIYRHNDIETPVVRIGYDTPDADYAFLVQANELLTSQDDLDVTVDVETGEFILSTKNNVAPAEYGLYVRRVDQENEFAFTRPDFSLDPNTTVTLVYGEWEGGGEGMRALVDYGSNGQIDKEIELPDQQIEFDFYEPVWDSSGND